MAGRLGEIEPRRQQPRRENPPSRRAHRAKALRPPLTEDQLHRSVAEYLDWVLLPPVFWSTFPAGWGKLSKAIGGRLKASGLKEGVPDILILYNGIAHWVELKTPGHYLTPIQDETHIHLVRCGCKVATCRSVESVALALRHWRIPVRAHAIQMANQAAEAREQAQPAQGAAQS